MINRIPDVGYRAELSQWARRDFKANKSVREEVSNSFSILFTIWLFILILQLLLNLFVSL